LTNCPVTVQDVNNAHHIYGRDLANIRGKTTRRKPQHVQIDYVQIPWDFVKMHKYVTLAADVMFVNGLPFLVTLSRGNTRFAWAGGTFLQLCCCVSFLFWRKIGFGFTYYLCT
jgi:hypothetical protein